MRATKDSLSLVKQWIQSRFQNIDIGADTDNITWTECAAGVTINTRLEQRAYCPAKPGSQESASWGTLPMQLRFNIPLIVSESNWPLKGISEDERKNSKHG